ncbi:hypothetical protein AB1Y20_010823 [Prymnesium parvum]|uniref:Poly(A) polymerase n=1 Tax=Prymnesium parvum TaxID=97485 RepID=A0AB34IQE3_PRYPA
MHSATIGGRAIRPALPPISTEGPSAFDLKCTERLMEFMASASPQESEEEQLKRVHVLSSIDTIFKEWVRSVCLSKGLPAEVVNAAGGAVFTSGSYRLGVNERGMDIDTICVAPREVTRHDFFDTLKACLEDHDSVENLSAIESATVPIITFDFDGVNVDLLFASLPLDRVTPDIDINNDAILQGVDVGTEKSLNGPRVTNMIEKLVPNFPSFLALVRCMGYLGGVNCNILAAFICQLYPNAAPSLLLERFFFILRDWKWPTPIMLTPAYDAGYGLECWDPQVGGNRFHVMPILTPAYPSMNSSMSVNTVTLEVMREEMAAAHEKTRAALDRGGEGWEELFAHSDFCVAHAKYLAAEIFVAGVAEHEHEGLLRSWTGYVESRLRKLTDFLAYLPLVRIRLMPKKLPLLTVKDAVRNEGVSYLIGFDVDRSRLKGEMLDLTNKVEAFKSELYFGAGKQGIVNETYTHEQLCFKVVTFGSWKELPDVVLQAVGARQGAKAARKAHVIRRRVRDGYDAAGPPAAAPATGAAAAAALPSGNGEAASNHAAGSLKRKGEDEEAYPAAKAARAHADETDEAPRLLSDAALTTTLSRECMDSLGVGDAEMGVGSETEGEAERAASTNATPPPRGKIKLTLS